MKESLDKIKSILPPPFDWCCIPAGKVMLEGAKGSYIPEGTKQSFDVSAFYMAKYPITNEQFAKFIEAGGYSNKKWWTETGWRRKEKENWTEPRHCNNAKFNDKEQPVIGFSWYEAIAFCLWLSEATSEKIMLPTEQQWQRAAQGDDERVFPWGNEFDENKANSDESKIGKTTPVTNYLDGASPSGVLDMAGTAWEWCLTDWEEGSSSLTGKSRRLQRGGSFIDPSWFLRTVFRNHQLPYIWYDICGFRICTTIS
jgi:iron(II)-dependent oxidoreductase